MQLEATTNDIAALLSITPRRVRQLTDEGHLKKTGRNKYSIAETVNAYIDYKINKLAIYKMTPLQLSRKKNIDIQTKIKEIHLSALKLELLPIEMIMDFWKTQFLLSRNKLLQIPNLIKNQKPNIDDDAAEFLKTKIREALDDLARTELPKDLQKKVGQYLRELERTGGFEVE